MGQGIGTTVVGLSSTFVTKLRALFDGSDETATLQAAVTAAAGGVLILPANKTIKTQQITVPAGGIHIRGQGGSVVDFIDPGAVGGVICAFNADGCAFFHVEDFTLTASNATARTSTHGLLRVKDVDGFTCRGMTFGKSSATAIWTCGVTNFAIDDIQIDGPTYADGIHLSRGTSHGTVSRVRGGNTGDDFVALNSYTELSGTPYGQMEDIQIRDIQGVDISTGRGVVVNGAKDVTVDRVYINGVDQAAVLVSRDTGTMYDPANVHIRGVIAHSTGRNVPGGGTSGAVYIAHLATGSVKDVSGSDTTVAVASTATNVDIGEQPRLFIPTTRMVLATGSPAHNATATHRIPVWLFDASSDESVSFTLSVTSDLPGWKTYTADLVWANASSGSGDVTWRLYAGAIADGGTLAAASQVGAVTATASAQDVITRTTIATGQAVGDAGTTQFFRVFRVATAGSDTLANDAQVIGLVLRRAT